MITNSRLQKKWKILSNIFRKAHILFVSYAIGVCVKDLTLGFLKISMKGLNKGLNTNVPYSITLPTSVKLAIKKLEKVMYYVSQFKTNFIYTFQMNIKV